MIRYLCPTCTNDYSVHLGGGIQYTITPCSQCSEILFGKFHYLKEGWKPMKSEKIQLPESLFKAWLEDETAKIAEMNDALAIHNHIIGLEQTIFEAKTRLSVSRAKQVKLMGADWAENSRSISDPNFVVNYESDPRNKKEKSESKPRVSKEEKQANLHQAAGIDINKLKAAIKEKMKAKAIAAALKVAKGE